MSRKEIIRQIIDVNIMYYFGIGHHTVDKDFEKWIMSILSKLSDKELKKEAKKCGINITSIE